MLGFFLFLHAVDANAMTKAVRCEPSAISNGVPPINLLDSDLCVPSSKNKV
jgi:hypothetical protein